VKKWLSNRFSWEMIYVQLDKYTIVHLVGASFIAIIFDIVTKNKLTHYSVSIGIICQYLWECFDAIYDLLFGKSGKINWLLDKRGASWIDMIICYLGLLILNLTSSQYMLVQKDYLILLICVLLATFMFRPKNWR